MTAREAKTIRCVIYTRKSHEEGLEQEFNSLDAQRDAGQAYIASQKHEGWRLIPKRYDDGGFSGGTTDRPALQELFADIRAGGIDCVVVYKVDRLSRSLLDFAQIIGLFDEHGVSFVSVTQQFNTTTSMGRLTLNILLSFAQFEREIIGERIRDKKLATARQGKYVGGQPVLGYDIVDKKYVVNTAEAMQVRRIFELFLVLQSSRKVAVQLNTEGSTTKQYRTKTGNPYGGRRWTQKHVYRLLTDRKYVGKVVHRGVAYAGEHEAIIPEGLFEQVGEVLRENCVRAQPNANKGQHQVKRWAMLRGLMRCGHCGSKINPTFTSNHGRQYRYYTCSKKAVQGYRKCPLPTLNAGEIERLVVEQLRELLRHPDVVARSYREICEQADQDGMALNEVVAALQSIDPVWDVLFPAERERIARLLIRGITVSCGNLHVHFQPNGIEEITQELTFTEMSR